MTKLDDALLRSLEGLHGLSRCDAPLAGVRVRPLVVFIVAATVTKLAGSMHT